MALKIQIIEEKTDMVLIVKCTQQTSYLWFYTVLERYIADWFEVRSSIVSRSLITWINFLYYTLKQLPIWSSSKVAKETMLACFKDHHPYTRVILDCTEIFTEMPSSFCAQSQTYSTYKNHNTS